jgi:hypothetical protein
MKTRSVSERNTNGDGIEVGNQRVSDSAWRRWQATYDKVRKKSFSRILVLLKNDPPA